MEIAYNKMNNKHTKTVSLGEVRKALIDANLMKKDEILSYVQTTCFGKVDLCIEKTN